MTERFTIKKELTIKEFHIVVDCNKENKKILECQKLFGPDRVKISRKFSNTSIILNCTKYIINPMDEDETEHITYLTCIYDVLDKLSLIYINNGNTIEKVLIFEDVREALKWFDKINNFILSSIENEDYERNIIKNDKLRIRQDYFLTLYNLIGKYHYRMRDYLKYSNIYFVSDLGIVNIKDYFNEETLASINIESFYGHYKDAVVRIIQNFVCYSRLCIYYILCNLITRIDDFFNYGTFISTKTIEDIINEDIKDIDNINKEDEE